MNRPTPRVLWGEELDDAGRQGAGDHVRLEHVRQVQHVTLVIPVVVRSNRADARGESRRGAQRARLSVRGGSLAVGPPRQALHVAVDGCAASRLR